ncbi:hypothetical protein AERO8C_50009 [Aeromonas veronii]|uniref:Uncharacterized protein n=1 Tax=Aeromonas veronii TaxID=654 RepID=A0A653L5X0_AERVE|nr:hypothetical protein AERO8C_50009 [Aeromonas veronii]
MDIGAPVGVIAASGHDAVSDRGRDGNRSRGRGRRRLCLCVVRQRADQPDLFALVAGDVVLAVLFDVVEQLVGEMHCLGDGEVVANADHPGGEGDGGGQLGDPQWAIQQAASGVDHHLVILHPLEQHDKLLAAPTDGAVHLADIASEVAGKGDQCQIPDAMAIGVVDRLEVVDIEDHQVVVLVEQTLAEHIPAWQSGQVVGVRQGAQPQVDLLPGHHAQQQHDEIDLEGCTLQGQLDEIEPAVGPLQIEIIPRLGAHKGFAQAEMPRAAGLGGFKRYVGAGRVDGVEGAQHIVKCFIDGDIDTEQPVFVTAAPRLMDEGEVHHYGVAHAEAVDLDIGDKGFIGAAQRAAGGKAGATEVVIPGGQGHQIHLDRRQSGGQHIVVGHHADQPVVIPDGVDIDHLRVGEGIAEGVEDVGGRVLQRNIGKAVFAFEVISVEIVAADAIRGRWLIEQMVLCQIAGDVLHLEDLGSLVEDLEHVLLSGGDEIHVVLDSEIGVVEDSAQSGQGEQGQSGHFDDELASKRRWPAQGWGVT